MFKAPRRDFFKLWDSKPPKPKPKSKCKTKLKECRKLVKELRKNQKPKPRGGLSEWQNHLNKYRSSNPNIPFRQAQKNASITWRQL